jgi:hypothetical protein
MRFDDQRDGERSVGLDTPRQRAYSFNARLFSLGVGQAVDRHSRQVFEVAAHPLERGEEVWLLAKRRDGCLERLPRDAVELRARVVEEGSAGRRGLADEEHSELVRSVKAPTALSAGKPHDSFYWSLGRRVNRGRRPSRAGIRSAPYIGPDMRTWRLDARRSVRRLELRRSVRRGRCAAPNGNRRALGDGSGVPVGRSAHGRAYWRPTLPQPSAQLAKAARFAAAACRRSVSSARACKSIHFRLAADSGWRSAPEGRR